VRPEREKKNNISYQQKYILTDLALPNILR
jgi:hypothetical protein